MKITAIDIYDIDLRKVPPHHHLVVLEVRTDAGVSGLGEIAMVYGDGAESCLAMARHLGAKYVLGSDAENPEALWQRIFRSSYWGIGRSLALYAAMSAYDIALWDIKGRAVGLPVHALLGGRVRDKIPLYANHWYRDAFEPAQFAERAADIVARGWRGVKFDPFRARADRQTPSGQHLDPATARRGIARVNAVREAIGPERDLFIDLHGALTARDAIRWGSELAAARPVFLEEPTDTLTVGPMAEIHRALPCVALAGGERLYTRQDFLPFLEARVFDVVQPDICLAGGFTEARKIATMAEAYQAQVQFHNCAGPICTAATIQLVAATSNCFVQEWFPMWEDNRYAIVENPPDLLAAEGHFNIAAHACRPGLGVSLDRDFIRPYLSSEIR